MICIKEKLSSSLIFVAAALTAAFPLQAATSGAAQTGLIAKADNAINANINPAGLTRIKSPEWVGQGLYFASTSNFEYTSDLEPGVVYRDEKDGSTVIPFIYYARPLTDKLGIGVNVTGNAFGADLGTSGPSRYLVKEWNIVTASLLGNLGYRLTSNLSVGGGVAANYTMVELKSAVFNPEPEIGDGEMKFEESDITFGYTLGTLYEFTPQTRVGLTYRSEIDPKASGSGKSSSKKARNMIIGGAAGAAIAGSAQGSQKGMLYEVNVGSAGVVQVVTDQREIRPGDCVAVEKSGDTANLRRVSIEYCDRANEAAIKAVEPEAREEAAECAAAKQQPVEADTVAAADLAGRKIALLCND